jgi:hypothetical protein
VHRDLNPPNILVSTIGEVKLSDFGIARAGAHASLTQHGNVRGKAGYLAPEQVQGLPFDGRADLFALGLTLHEALTGAPALQGATELELLQAAVSGNVPAPSKLAMNIPPELDAAVMGLLEVDPARRTASGAQLQRQLMALSGAAAPYPKGREELAAALRACATKKKAPRPSPEAVDLRLGGKDAVGLASPAMAPTGLSPVARTPAEQLAAALAPTGLSPVVRTPAEQLGAALAPTALSPTLRVPEEQLPAALAPTALSPTVRVSEELTAALAPTVLTPTVRAPAAQAPASPVQPEAPPSAAQRPATSGTQLFGIPKNRE